jgi:hypothetical protein
MQCDRTRFDIVSKVADLYDLGLLPTHPPDFILLFTKNFPAR